MANEVLVNGYYFLRVQHQQVGQQVIKIAYHDRTGRSLGFKLSLIFDIIVYDNIKPKHHILSIKMLDAHSSHQFFNLVYSKSYLVFFTIQFFNLLE